MHGETVKIKKKTSYYVPNPTFSGAKTSSSFYIKYRVFYDALFHFILGILLVNICNVRKHTLWTTKIHTHTLKHTWPPWRTCKSSPYKRSHWKFKYVSLLWYNFISLFLSPSVLKRSHDKRTVKKLKCTF